MRIYISGKITGIEEHAIGLFAQAEAALRAQGFEPINPMALPHLHDKEWHSYMREDIKALCDCDAIYMLNNWKASAGARLEHVVAECLGLKVIYEEVPELSVVYDVVDNEKTTYQATGSNVRFSVDGKLVTKRKTYN